jgi:effector-binding domain-containing protein
MMMYAVQKLKYEKREVAGARAFLTQEEENCVQTGASLKLFA